MLDVRSEKIGNRLLAGGWKRKKRNCSVEYLAELEPSSGDRSCDVRATLRSSARKSYIVGSSDRVRQKARGKILRAGGPELRSGYALLPFRAATFPRFIL